MSILDMNGSIACAECGKNARVEYNKLKVENAKLRKENDTLMHRIDELCMENEKLRELADSSYTFAFNCYHGVFDQEAFFKLREKYHDFGIEVDEWERRQ